MEIVKKTYVIKTWDELTEAEKEEQIEKNSESISMDWQDMLYEDYKYELEEIQAKYKEKGITFEDVYLDENSQGWWIDSIKKLQVNRSINIYGEELSVYDVDIKFRRYMYLEDVYLDDYYIEEAKLKRIENTKKYKKFMDELKKDIQDMFDEINNIAENYFINEYDITRDFIDSCMEWREFEYLADDVINEQIENKEGVA